MRKYLFWIFGAAQSLTTSNNEVECVKITKVIAHGKNLMVSTIENGKCESLILKNNEFTDYIGVHPKTIVSYDKCRGASTQELQIVKTVVNKNLHHKGICLNHDNPRLILQATSKNKVLTDNELLILGDSYQSLNDIIKPQQQFITPILVYPDSKIKIQAFPELKKNTAVSYVYNSRFREFHELNMLKEFYGPSSWILTQKSTGFYRQHYTQGNLYKFVSDGNPIFGQRYELGYSNWLETTETVGATQLMVLMGGMLIQNKDSDIDVRSVAVDSNNNYKIEYALKDSPNSYHTHGLGKSSIFKDMDHTL